MSACHRSKRDLDLRSDQLQLIRELPGSRERRRYTAKHQLTWQPWRSEASERRFKEALTEEEAQLESNVNRVSRLTSAERELNQAKALIQWWWTTFSQPLIRLRRREIFLLRKWQLSSYNRQLWCCRVSKMETSNKTCNWSMKYPKKKRKESHRTWYIHVGYSLILARLSPTSWVRMRYQEQLINSSTQSNKKTRRLCSSCSRAVLAWQRLNWWSSCKTLTSFRLTNSSSCSWFWRTDGRKSLSRKSKCSTATFTTSWLRTWLRQSLDWQV